MKDKKANSYLLIGIACLLIAFVFSPALFHDFTEWDDGEHVTRHPAVRALSGHNLRYIFTTTVLKTYIPLTVLSFAAEYQLVGGQPFLYHLDNILLHLSVVLALFIFGIRLGLSQRASIGAAVLFGIHPLHVESVAWISARKDVLYSIFYLLALMSYWDYLERGKKLSFLMTMIWSLASILSKPMALSLPLILLLLDTMKGRKGERRMFFEKIPIILMMVLIAAMTYRHHARLPIDGAGQGLLIWLWTLSFYLQKFIIPWDLSPLYQLPKPVSLANVAYLQAVVFFGVLMFALIRWRKSRWFLFALGYYFLSIFFLLRFDDAVDTSIVADRYMYLPSLGLCLWLGWCWDRAMIRLLSAKGWLQGAGWAMTILFVIIMGFMTYRQTMVWKNDETLWQRVMELSPGQAIAYNNRGRIEEKKGHLEQALNYYEQALSLKTDYEEARLNKGVIYFHLGEWSRAVEEFELALRINPRSPQAFCHRGLVYAERGDIRMAMADYQQALSINPNYAQAYNNRGILFEKTGDRDLALSDYERALVLEPEYSEAHNNRGNVLRAQGRFNEAWESYSLAIRFKPNNAKAYNNRGVVNSQMGREKEALNDYNKAIALNPNYLEAYGNRAISWEKTGRREEALKDYERILMINPDYADAYLNRGILRVRQGAVDLALVDFDRALQINPRWAVVFFLRAQLYLQENEREKARRDAQRAQESGYPEAENLLRILEQGPPTQ